MSDTQTALALDSLVRIRNVSDKPFRGKVGPNQYIVLPSANEPGSESIFTWAIACGFVGDPNITDPRERAYALQRLRTYYGVYDDRARWETDLPKLEVYDLSTNERVFMLLDDPDGNRNLIPATLPPKDQAIALLQHQIATMQAQQNALIAELSKFMHADRALVPAEGPQPFEGLVGDGTAVGGADVNAPITQAPVVTGQNPAGAAAQAAAAVARALQQTGAASAVDGPPGAAAKLPDGPQPDGSLVVNGVVIPKGGRAMTDHVDVPDANDPAERTARARAGSSGGAWKSAPAATEDRPQVA